MFLFSFIIDPACQNISTELRCYVMDKKCRAQSNTEESFGHFNVILSIGCVMIVIITVCIIITVFYKRRKANIKKSKLNNIIYFIHYSIWYFIFAPSDIKKSTGFYLVTCIITFYIIPLHWCLCYTFPLSTSCFQFHWNRFKECCCKIITSHIVRNSSPVFL